MRLTKKEINKRALSELEPGDFFRFPGGSCLYIVTDDGQMVCLHDGELSPIEEGHVVIRCDCDIEYWEVRDND